MAVGPYQVYHLAQRKILDNTIDLINDNLQALLLVDGHNVDLATDATVNDVKANEVAGGGDYARISPIGGKSLVNTAGESEFDMDDLDFGDTVTIAARYVVIAKDTSGTPGSGANDATDEVLFICDLTGGGNASSTDGNFDIINTNKVHKWVANQ